MAITMYTIKTLFIGGLVLPALAVAELRNWQYLASWHTVMPANSQTAPITHVAMSFMSSSEFNRELGNHTWTPMWQSVADTRAQFPATTKVLIAIGGWGDVAGFDVAARTSESRQRWAANVASFIADSGCDGVDMDWEYPGGNGPDYKQIPNEQKAWEVEAYPLLLAEVRKAIGPDKLLTAAVPGKVGDMIAFTPDTVPSIMKEVDFLNVMTYDLMNRRDNITKHHTGVKGSIESLDAYISRGASAEQLNLGFAYYAKWFKTKHDECSVNPIGCPTVLMEDPVTGDDLGQSGAFGWVDGPPANRQDSFQRALTQGKIDPEDGSYYYWDSAEDIFWTFDLAENIRSKFATIVAAKHVGGVAAWELGNDGTGFERFAATNEGVLASRLAHYKKKLGGKRRL